jgi:CheY-like chemotaxis protein
MVGNGSTVLVVDDSPLERATAVDMLAGMGFKVLDAYSGATALRVLAEHPEVSLLFADVRMPGMSGPQLAEAAQALRPDLKVIFTSGYAKPRYSRSHVPFVPKPWRMSAIAEAISTANSAA